MKRIVFVLLVASLAVQAQQKAKPEVKPIASSTTYTSVALDKQGRLWVGTNKEGLWLSEIDSLTGNIQSLSRYSTDDVFNKYNIQAIAVSNAAVGSKVWVANNGDARTTAAGGGLQLFENEQKKGRKYIPELGEYYAKGLGLFKEVKNDGLPTGNGKAVAIDKFGSVWTAHGYTDLTVTGNLVFLFHPLLPPSVIGKGGYYVKPGGIGFMAAGQSVFENVATNYMPYPAYTINTPIDKTAGTRQCYAVACGPNEVWVGTAAYEKDEGGVFDAGIQRFDFAGKSLGSFDGINTISLPFTVGYGSPIPMALHFSKSGDGFVGFNRNLGFGVYKDGTWKHIKELGHYNKETQFNELSTLVPNGIIRLNTNAPNIISSAGKRVYIGTQDGLLVYKGRGDYAQDSSYILVTTADGLYSNNVKAVVAGPKYVYVVTDAGLNQVYVPGDVEVFHIKDKSKPNEHQNNNYQSMATLETQKDNGSNDKEGLPMIAADGTKSTLFRYYTNDFDGFYNSNKYIYGVNADYDSRDTAQYGKFRLRPIANYEDKSKSYVDFIYTHPSHIDPNALSGNSTIFQLSIGTRINSNLEFLHDIQITLPPVLLIHGVWSETNSLNQIESTLLGAGYKDFQIKKGFRSDGQAAEISYEGGNKDVLPYQLSQLFSNAALNGMSAGKAAVVVHSRGGLYTRAYVEELYGGKYKDDVYSLITLNTPHSGSQMANLILDARKLPVINQPVGSLFQFFIPSKNDRLGKEGAQGLRVDLGFIEELNNPWNLQKFIDKKIPLHIIATDAQLCKLPTSYCDLDVFELLTFIPRLKKAGKVLSAISHDIPAGGDAFLKYVFNGEGNDIIVPKSSMQAGVPQQYVSHFRGENIAHVTTFEDVGLPIYGVTRAPSVLNKIVSLLKEDATSASSSFTTGGVNPPYLTYDFAPLLGQPDFQPSQPRLEDLASDFKINYKGASLKEGDSLKFAVRTKGFSSLFVSYEHEFQTPDSVYVQDKTVKDTLTPFAFKIPTNFYGHMMVIAYGSVNGTLAAVDTLHVQIGINPTVTLLSLAFEGVKEIKLKQNQRYDFNLVGTFSDSHKRVINAYPNVKYYIEDTVLLKKEGPNTLYAKTKSIGRSSFLATYDNLIATLDVSISPNPSLKKTVVSKFVGLKQTTSISIDWSTSQEYRHKRFVLERSKGNGAFDSLYAVNGKGTTYTSHLYRFNDLTTYTTEKVYYRLKLVDSTGNALYTDTIMVETGVVTGLTETEQLGALTAMSVFPNPSNQEGFKVEFGSVTSDANAELIVYDFEGKAVLFLPLSVTKGRNLSPSIQLPNLPQGIYFLKIKTAAEVQSAKIILSY